MMIAANPMRTLTAAAGRDYFGYFPTVSYSCFIFSINFPNTSSSFIEYGETNELMRHKTLLGKFVFKKKAHE